LTLAAYPGVADEYGYCDRLTFTNNNNDVDYTCRARISSADGHVVTDAWVLTTTLANAKSATLALAPLAAQRLATLPAAS
jgi:hypothetical protein